VCVCLSRLQKRTKKSSVYRLQATCEIRVRRGPAGSSDDRIRRLSVLNSTAPRSAGSRPVTDRVTGQGLVSESSCQDEEAATNSSVRQPDKRHCHVRLANDVSVTLVMTS